MIHRLLYHHWPMWFTTRTGDGTYCGRCGYFRRAA
jgi:hypothetical protein